MGESAGGGHAAMLAILPRDRGEVALAFQCQTYPMLDDRTGSSRKVRPHAVATSGQPRRTVLAGAASLGESPGCIALRRELCQRANLT